MSDSRKTGLSPITGKTVVIRHANTSDLARVEEYLKKYGNAEGLGNADVVVATEAERIIGFGLLKKESDAGCLSVFEDSRRKGIGSSIIRHLVQYEPLKQIYASRSVSYFTRYGFVRGRGGRTARTTRRRDGRGMPLMEPLPIAAFEKP